MAASGILIGDKLYSSIALTLENCLISDEKLSLTASITDGLDREVETDLRIVGCELIQAAGILLKLPQVGRSSRAAPPNAGRACSQTFRQKWLC